MVACHGQQIIKDAFSTFGRLLDAKVVVDKESVLHEDLVFLFFTFEDKHAMEGIEAMNEVELSHFFFFKFLLIFFLLFLSSCLSTI